MWTTSKHELDHPPVEAQGSGCWLNSLLTLSCTSFWALPSSSFCSPPPPPPPPPPTAAAIRLRPSSSSSSSIPLLLRSSSSWVTRFSQACEADARPGLGGLGTTGDPSPRQAPTSSEGNLGEQETYTYECD